MSDNNETQTVPADPEKSAVPDGPHDKYYVVTIFFFTLGLIHLLPWTFFITAHEYWMYKFRDTANDSASTTLQTEFSPSQTIVLNLTTVLAGFLSFFFAHSFDHKTKLFAPLIAILALLIFAACFIEIDTDSWQMGFFVLTMFIIALISTMNMVFGINTYSILSKFPRSYIGPYMSGQGLSSIATACLQILSLAIGFSTKGSAVVYFVVGILLVAATLCFATLVFRYNDFFKFHFAKHEVTKIKRSISLHRARELVKIIWICLFMMFMIILSVNPVHTAVTSLVVSEYKGSGPWHDKYFVPVTTFLLPSIADFLGRVSAQIFQITNKPFYVIFTTVRLVFIPLLMLCNAHPRYHLPVVFDHDYEYAIILIIFQLTQGYLLSICSFLIPHLTPQEDLEDTYTVYNVCVSVIVGGLAFLPFVSVKLI